MKALKLFLFLVALFSSFSFDLFAQGSVGFSTVGAPPEKRIYVGDWTIVNGQPEFVSWQPCSGVQYRVALYWGAAGGGDGRHKVQGGRSLGFLSCTKAGRLIGGAGQK